MTHRGPFQPRPFCDLAHGIASHGSGVFGPSRLTRQPSHVDGRPCAGCRSLAGSHRVVAFCVHIHLDYVSPFCNFERKQESGLSPGLECKSTSALRHGAAQNDREDEGTWPGSWEVPRAWKASPEPVPWPQRPLQAPCPDMAKGDSTRRVGGERLSLALATGHAPADATAPTQRGVQRDEGLKLSCAETGPVAETPHPQKGLSAQRQRLLSGKHVKG